MRRRWRVWFRLALGVAGIYLGVLLALRLALLVFAGRPGLWAIGWAQLLADSIIAGCVAALVAALMRLLRREHRRADLSQALAQEVIDSVPDGLLIADAEGCIVRSNVALMNICNISPLGSAGRNLSEYGLLDDDGSPTQWPVQGRLRARVSCAEPNRRFEIETRPIAGEPALRLLHVRDITAEIEDMERRQRDGQLLEILARLARAFNRVVDEVELLQAVADEVRQQIPCTSSAGLFAVDRQAGVLRLVAASGLKQSFIEAEREVPLGECLCGHAALTGEIVISPSCRLDPAHVRRPEGPPHGNVVVPIKGADETLAVLFLCVEENTTVTTSFTDLLLGAAAEIGLALVRVREHENLKSEVEVRRRTEELLRAREKQYRNLIQFLPAGVIVHSNGQVVLANRSAERIFGADSTRSLVGLPLNKLVHPDFRELVSGRVKSSLQQDSPAALIEEKLLRLDGTPFDAEVAGLPVTFEGQPAMLAVFNDITERKRSEQKSET